MEKNGNNNGMMGVIMVIMLIIFIVSVGYIARGLSMHSQVFEEEAEFHRLQDEYFSVSKEDRDAADTNSELNEDLVVIQNFPSKLLTLKLVGIGKILTGIYLLLLDILIALVVMPMRLGQLIIKNMTRMMQR